MDPSTTLPLTVTLAVLAAAVTHATWNAIAHGIKDQTLAFALIGVGGIVSRSRSSSWRPLPRADCWPYLLGSVAIHVFYNLLLMQCYRLGEFGQVYPLARGISPLVVTVLAAIFVHEHLALPQVGGVSWFPPGWPSWSSAAPGGPRGLPGRRRHRPDHRGLYHGGRRRACGCRAASVGYIGWLMLLQSLCVPMFALIRRRDVLLKQPRRILLPAWPPGR